MEVLEQIEQIQQKKEKYIKFSKDIEKVIPLYLEVMTKSGRNKSPYNEVLFAVNILKSLKGIIEKFLFVSNLLDEKNEDKLKKLNDIGNDIDRIISNINPSNNYLGISTNYEILKQQENKGFNQYINDNIKIAFQQFNNSNVASQHYTIMSFFSDVIAIENALDSMIHEIDNVAGFENIYERLKKSLEEKLRRIEDNRKNLEDLLKENILEKFAEKYKENIKKTWIAFGFSFFFSTLALLGIIYFSSRVWNLLNKQDPVSPSIFLFKISIGLFLVALFFLLVRYTMKLYDRIEEYRYKKLVLSTFPALNTFIEDDEKRFQIIRDLILHNSKLSSISSKGEDLSLDNLTNILKILKDYK